MMKKCFLLLLVLLLLPCCVLGETVVTSFYPIWLIALNLTEGLEGVEVHNLAAPDTGCLHDYQLQIADMKALDKADLFLVNGAGMESYLDKIYASFPNLPVVTASDHVSLLYGLDALEIGEAEEEEGEENAHIWLDPMNAVQMAQNLATGLQQVLPECTAQIQQNLENYTARMENLDATIREGLQQLKRRDIITFHEAFPYFAKAYDLNVVAVVNREPGETLALSQLETLIDVVKQLDTPPLFVEPQYEDLSARTLASETGAAVYTLDPVVTGPEKDVPLDYYEQKMLENMLTLQEALGWEAAE